MFHGGRDVLLHASDGDAQFSCHFAIGVSMVIALLEHISGAFAESFYFLFYEQNALFSLTPILLSLGGQCGYLGIGDAPLLLVLVDVCKAFVANTCEKVAL